MSITSFLGINKKKIKYAKPLAYKGYIVFYEFSSRGHFKKGSEPER
jgi:hypothetical protein